MNDKNIKTNTKNNKTNTENFNSQNFNKKNNITNLSYSIIKDSLDYYDKYQPDIQKILSKIEYIKINIGDNVNDEYMFYDSNDKIILKSKIETLSIYIPQNKTWKWSWSVPFAKYKNTLISREILKYAFTLDTDNDLFLKSTLVNSKIVIQNNYQIDIYLALSSLLSKKPFILRMYLIPQENDANINNKKYENIYEFKKILNRPDKKNYISVFLLILDWNNE
jgi:hypothetical protein